jgi:hypothetical protein
MRPLPTSFRAIACFREVVSSALERLRDRDRALSARAGTRSRGRRSPYALLCTTKRIRIEAQHLARWSTYPGYHCRVVPFGAAAALFFLDRRRAGDCIGCARNPDLHHLFQGRRGSARADGNPFHWAYALAFLSIVAGLMLDTVTKGRREMKRLAYLQQRAPEEKWDA